MELLLQKGEMMNLKGTAHGCRFSCRSGLLWVTQAGDDRDHLLPSGADRVLKGRGRIVLTALTDVVLRVDPGAGARSVRLQVTLPVAVG